MAVTELVKRLEEMALEVEALFDEPHIDLSDERNAELESFGEWTLAALGSMSRIAEHQVLRDHHIGRCAGASFALATSDRRVIVHPLRPW